MATYFEDHPPRLHQWQPVRDPKGVARFHEATGTFVIHTFEANISLGTKRAADFLVNRTDRQASYHALCGPASGRDVIQMAPWSGAAWHETHSNRWSIGISMVAQAGAWDRISRVQRANLVASAAYAAFLAATWLGANRGIHVPARRITRAQAMNGQPGFISHGEMDPGRRSDPGAGFPWDLFLSTYADLMGEKGSSTPTPLPEKDEVDMASIADITKAVTAAVPSVGDFARAVWGYELQGYNEGEEWGAPPESIARRLRRAADRAGRAMVLGRRNAAELAGVKAMVRELGKAQGLDPEQLERILTTAVNGALADKKWTLATESKQD